MLVIKKPVLALLTKKRKELHETSSKNLAEDGVDFRLFHKKVKETHQSTLTALPVGDHKRRAVNT